MSDARDILCELITRHGRDLSENAARCEAFLRDYCPHERGRVNVLVGAVRERVTIDLLSVSSVIPVEFQMARLVKRLEDYLGLREDIAQWAVESWAMALGLVEPPTPVTPVTSDSDELAPIRKAADQGDADAQFNLGVCFDNGRGAPQDHREAVKWFLKAASQGHIDAQNKVGIQYRNGQGVPQDHAEAVKWFRKAADQGLAGAQFNLGHLYANGQGVPQNHAEAVKWFHKAADQGDVRSQFHLGTCHEMGIGVERDRAEAVKWYRKAADQGHIGAQKRI